MECSTPKRTHFGPFPPILLLIGSLLAPGPFLCGAYVQNQIQKLVAGYNRPKHTSLTLFINLFQGCRLHPSHFMQIILFKIITSVEESSVNPIPFYLQWVSFLYPFRFHLINGTVFDLNLKNLRGQGYKNNSKIVFLCIKCL